MSLAVVAIRTEFEVKVDRRRVPVKDLKVDPFEAAGCGSPGDKPQDRFANALAPKSVVDKNVFKVKPGLAAKAREMGIEDGIADEVVIFDRYDGIDESFRSKYRLAELLIGDLTIIAEILELGKVTHQFNDAGDVFRFYLANFHSY